MIHCSKDGLNTCYLQSMVGASGTEKLCRTMIPKVGAGTSSLENWRGATQGLWGAQSMYGWM